MRSLTTSRVDVLRATAVVLGVVTDDRQIEWFYASVVVESPRIPTLLLQLQIQRGSTPPSKLVIREIRFQLWNKINKLLSTIHPIVTSCVLIDAVDVCVIMHSSFQGLSWERLYHILPQDWITCSLSAVFANSPIVICHCNLYLLFRNLHRSYRLSKDHSFRPCRLGTYVKP